MLKVYTLIVLLVTLPIKVLALTVGMVVDAFQAGYNYDKIMERK